MLFYIGLGLQLIGFASVGLCLFSGISVGDYDKLALFQFIGGSAVFYLGHFFKAKGSPS